MSEGWHKIYFYDHSFLQSIILLNLSIAEYREMDMLINSLPTEEDVQLGRRMDDKVLERIRNSENFFDLLEMAYERRKYSLGK